MKRDFESIATDLGTIDQSLLERAGGADLLKDKLIELINSVGYEADQSITYEIEGVIGLLGAMSGSLMHTAGRLEACKRDLRDSVEANAGRPS